jgi:hypothetical protein
MSEKLKRYVSAVGAVAIGLLTFGTNIKSDNIASIPTVEFGQTAHAFKYKPVSRKTVQYYAGYCATNIRDEINAANRNARARNLSFRFGVSWLGIPVYYSI